MGRVATRAHALARGGIGLALSLSALLLFTGVLNGINAFFVPLVLAVTMRRCAPSFRWGVGIGLLLMVLFWAPRQIVFAPAYMGLAFTMPEKRSIPHLVMRIFLLWLLFPLGGVLTDLLFGTQILTLTLRGVGGWWPYGGMTLALTLFIVFLQEMALRAVGKYLALKREKEM